MQGIILQDASRLCWPTEHVATGWTV